jgi:hypothetical protein
MRNNHRSFTIMMFKIGSRLLAGAAAFVLAAGVYAAPKFKHANGGVALSGPSQYVEFSVFDYGASGDRGTVTYTNFEYPAAGSGVWTIGGTVPLTVSLGGADFAHTMTITSVTPLSPTSVKFTGTGVYTADPTVTWTVMGVISGSDITFTIVYTGTNAGYTFNGTGTINADGSITGTGTDSLGQTPLTFSIPAGSVKEVLSYAAQVTCVDISGADATFSFTIPEGFADLSGTDVVAQVHDGGQPARAGDTWGHGLATGPCQGAVTNYPITSGNIVVHQKP